VNTLLVREFGPRQGISASAATLGLTAERLRIALTEVGGRVALTLGILDSVEFYGDTFRVGGTAGILQATPGLQLEIMPKFLEGGDPTWREDFFVIANLVKFGRILPKEALPRIASRSKTLSDLVGRAAVYLFDQRSRNPVREYRRRSWVSPDLDGDPEPESLLIPDEDGFLQEGSVFDRINPVNRVMADAFEALGTQVADGDVRRQLQLRRYRLGDQSVERFRPRTKLPPRQRNWQPLYDLSRDVLRGFATDYWHSAVGGKRGSLPGYLIDTTRAWEHLIYTALRIALGPKAVEKRAYDLGTRQYIGGRKAVVQVTPDVSIHPLPTVLIDAKYKTLDTKTGAWIKSSDLYEALAFSRASGIKRVVLLYPQGGASDPTNPPGSGDVVESIEVGEVEVVAATVRVAGVGTKGAILKFSSSLADRVRAFSELRA